MLLWVSFLTELVAHRMTQKSTAPALQAEGPEPVSGSWDTALVPIPHPAQHRHRMWYLCCKYKHALQLKVRETAKSFPELTALEGTVVRSMTQNVLEYCN